MIIGLLQVSAHSTAQVTLKENAASLEKVLVAIKQQSGYDLFFNRSILKAKARLVIVDVNNVPVEQALQAVFKNQDQLTYSLNGNIISVKEKPEKKSDLVTEGLNPRLEPTLPPTVHGRITNEKGEAVAGVSISIKGGKTIGVTNDDGMFTLTNVPDNAILVFSAVNVETREVALANNPGLKSGASDLNLVLKTKTSVLDEVQMIAYGSTSKRLQTGNVTTVKGEDIAKQPVSNPLLALEGRVPGLFITQANGLPGSGVTVRIQGKNSITKGNDPLYIIDGVPYTSQLLPNFGGPLGGSGGLVINGVADGSGNPLSFINPADIESIDVLKDADATAIYGSRAANGAILITTKRGKAGNTKVDINMQNGWGKVSHKLKLLNTQQYLQMRNEAIKNDGLTPDPNADYDLTLWDTTRNTDWQKVLIGGTAHYTDIHATISGGNTNTQFLIGSGYHRETTVFPGDFADQKGSLNLSLINTSVNQKFRVQLSVNYMVDNNQLPQYDLTSTAIQLAPNAPALYNANGSLNWMPDGNGTSTWLNQDNPLSDLYNTYENKTSNLVSNAVLSYKILPGLELRSNFGYTDLKGNEFTANPLIAVAPENRAGTQRGAGYSNSEINSWIIEPQASFKRNISKGTFEILVGTTISQNKTSFQQLTGSGYNSDNVLEDIKSATSVSIGATGRTVYRYNAVFGRINYNWNEKYILNISARRDGSSRFGTQSQFHNFEAAGLAWVFTKEKLINKVLPFMSFGKLRGSYGTTGSDQIGDYQFMNLYSSFTVGMPYQNINGLQVRGLPNPYLQWEETRKLQFGLDLGFLKDRILLTMNYVHNRSSNELLPYSLPIITGFTNIGATNFPATIQNTAWEFALNTTNIKSKNFTWNSSINLTIPQNKLIAFQNLATSAYASILIIGQPITIGKFYHYSGVDPTTGIYQFTDSHGQLTSSPKPATDHTVLLNSAPTFYGGFQNSFSYKGIRLDFLVQFVKQLGSNNMFGSLGGAAFSSNQPVSVLNRWRNPGDIASIQKYNSDYSLFFHNGDAIGSDAAYSDASYIRLKNLSLSWELPGNWKKKVHFQDCRLFVQGQNLLTITKYDGLDPETKSLLGLPTLKVLTVGLRVGLQ